MMSLLCPPLHPWIQPFILIKIYWNRMIPFVTGLHCQYKCLLNFWGSVCTTHTSLSKINSMNRLKEWPWGHHSALYLPICTWSILKGKSLGLPPTPKFWFWFVNDTFVIQQQAHKQLFLDHINSIDPAIMFTVKGNQENPIS